MENCKRIETEFQLPEAIIQRIQSFLHGNEAAQTTILSRSWYHAWLTRPNLDFDQNLFVNRSDDEFWEFAIKTMERYDKLNLTINSLRLWISNKHLLVNELIIKALKMGATCLDFKIHNKESEFALSHQVFGFENLTGLSVSGCKIGDNNNGTVINCCKLKSLSLDRVYVRRNIIWEIISSCTLIENLSFSSIWGLTVFGKQNVFRNLKCLYLYRIRLPLSYFHSFSSKFPRLVDLALHDCDCTDVERIYSPSLECINFNCCNMVRIEFDFPRIRKFTYLGSVIPSLSFSTTTRKWESRITIERVGAPSAEWFLELSGLLKKLSSSEVTLQLDVWSEKCLGYTGEFRGLSSKPKVGCLLINGSYSGFPAFYYYLLECCCPDYISHVWIPRGVQKESDNKYFVVKRKMQQVCLYSCIAYQNMSECDLRKVEVKFYDDSVSEWLLSRSLDATAITSLGAVSDEQEIRFYLKWER